MLNLHKIWIKQCEAAKGIEDDFGVVPAMKYRIGEKFMNYLVTRKTWAWSSLRPDGRNSTGRELMTQPSISRARPSGFMAW